MTDRRTVYLLAAESGLNPITIARFFQGERVHPATAQVLRDACKRLSIAPPVSVVSVGTIDTHQISPGSTTL